ncbi:MAG: Crp/Fnr family transcriptional regulator [Coriobacteriia bacterium]
MKASSAKDVIIARLRQDPVFSRMEQHDLESLAAVMSFREYPKGSFVVTRNDTSTLLFLLVAGRVKVSVASPEGKELALSYLEAPSYFGEMGVVDAAPRSADVIATTDIEVLIVEGKDLATVFRIQPEAAIALVSTLTRRLRELVARLEGMAFHDATHRVMRVMLNVSTASYEARGVPVIEGLTHYEIATLAGTSRETASRVISNLCRDGVVATKGRKIVVDLFALRDLVERDQQDGLARTRRRPRV